LQVASDDIFPAFSQTASSKGILVNKKAIRSITKRNALAFRGADLMELQPRLQMDKIAPEVLKTLLQVSAYIHNHSGLEPSLLNLVFLRASQINGCAWCIDMHTKDARALGETEQRLYLVSAWREAPFYTERERAAFAWTEAVTLVAKDHVPDDVYENVKPHFTDNELVNLTLAVTQINAWNRFNVAFRNIAGSYQPNVQQLKKTA
jgi:AhpD family alkylhydroperoxidase